MTKTAMDVVEKILGPGKDDESYWAVLPFIDRWRWTSKIFYRKGAGARKCLIGCNGTEVWIWVGSPPIEDHKLDLREPDSIQKIKQIMRVK
jgi:hypothetical protein